MQAWSGNLKCRGSHLGDRAKNNGEDEMWRCTICGYVYDEAKEGTKFEDLPDDWACPVCNAPKDAFVRM